MVPRSFFNKKNLTCNKNVKNQRESALHIAMYHQLCGITWNHFIINVKMGGTTFEIRILWSETVNVKWNEKYRLLQLIIRNKVRKYVKMETKLYWLKSLQDQLDHNTLSPLKSVPYKVIGPTHILFFCNWKGQDLLFSRLPILHSGGWAATQPSVQSEDQGVQWTT